MDKPNLWAVARVSPTHDLIDGIRLEEVAGGLYLPRDNSYSTGGITSSGELLSFLRWLRVENLQVIPDFFSAKIRILANILYAGKNASPLT